MRASVLQKLVSERYTQPAIALEFMWHVIFGEPWEVAEPDRDVLFPHPSASPTPRPDSQLS
jgi:hypothetical protein